jgi:hypothetical protein
MYTLPIPQGQAEFLRLAIIRADAICIRAITMIQTRKLHTLAKSIP